MTSEILAVSETFCYCDTGQGLEGWTISFFKFIFSKLITKTLILTLLSSFIRVYRWNLYNLHTRLMIYIRNWHKCWFLESPVSLLRSWKEFWRSKRVKSFSKSLIHPLLLDLVQWDIGEECQESDLKEQLYNDSPHL